MHKNNTENKIKVSLEFHNNIFDFYRKRDKSSSSQNSFMKWVLPFGTKRRWLFDQGLNRVGILVSKGWRSFWNDRVLEGIRARNKELSRRKALIDKGKRQWGGKRILYILPVIYRAGGAYVIFQESKAMLDMGVNVCLMNLKQYKEKFESNYPELELPVIYSEPKNIGIIAKRFDAVISTMNTVVNWLEYIIEKNGKPLRGYYIQDFEPYFYEETSTDFKIAMESYILFSDIIRLTKTKWNEEIVKVKTGAICHVVGPSVDIDLFMPRPRYKEDSQNRPICIGAMIRPTSPRRGPLLQ
jgi:hypothetical protein